MVAKKPIGQICKKCRERNPKKAKYCMNCGKTLKSRSSKVWPGKILRVKKGLDPKTVVNVILATVSPRYINFNPKKVTEEDLREALAWRSQKSQQLVIRLTGADGKPPRSTKEVAEELGIRPHSVQITSGHAFFALAIDLRRIRPSEEFKRRT